MIKETAKNLAKTALDFASKNSPYILSITGAGLIVAGAITLVKKAKNSKEVVDKKVQLKIEKVHEPVEEETRKERSTKLIKTYSSVAFDYMKYYGVPVILMSAGVFSMFSGMLIQTQRLKVMSTAYTSLAAAYASCQKNLREAVGEEKAYDIINGIKRDENGNVIEDAYRDPKEPDKDEVLIEDKYSRLFDNGTSWLWSKDSRLNMDKIRGAESNVNARLRAKGFVTLNEVWEELGFSYPSKEGCLVGWRYVHGDPVYGSTWIDFGIHGAENAERIDDYIHSWNNGIWINVIPPHTIWSALPSEENKNKLGEMIGNIRENMKKAVCHE